MSQNSSRKTSTYANLTQPTAERPRQDLAAVGERKLLSQWNPIWRVWLTTASKISQSSLRFRTWGENQYQCCLCVYISHLPLFISLIPSSVFCLSQCLFATSQHVCLWDPSKTTSISDNTPRPSHLPLFSEGVWICWAFNNTDLSDSLKTAFQRQRPHTHSQGSIRHSLCVTGLLWNHQACI